MLKTASAKTSTNSTVASSDAHETPQLEERQGQSATKLSEAAPRDPITIVRRKERWSVSGLNTKMPAEVTTISAQTPIQVQEHPYMYTYIYIYIYIYIA